MQSCLGKFFKPVSGAEKREEMHDFLFQKEHADRGKRLRQEEDRELAVPGREGKPTVSEQLHFSSSSPVSTSGSAKCPILSILRRSTYAVMGRPLAFGTPQNTSRDTAEAPTTTGRVTWSGGATRVSHAGDGSDHGELPCAALGLLLACQSEAFAQIVLNRGERPRWRCGIIIRCRLRLLLRGRIDYHHITIFVCGESLRSCGAGCCCRCLETCINRAVRRVRRGSRREYDRADSGAPAG